MLVKVTDENDSPPRWTKSEWNLEVMEEQPPNEPLAKLAVQDPDITNTFQYRVSEYLLCNLGLKLLTF